MPLIDPVTMSSAGASPSSPPKISLPVDLLTTNLAQYVSLAHPALLLALYFGRFSSLVAEPVHELLRSLAPLAVIQVAYAFSCLPAVGTKGGRKVKPGEKARKESELSVKGFTIAIALTLALISALPILTLFILFGAPLTTHLPHTILLSLHVSLLSVFPLIYVHGTSASKWREIMSLSAPMDVLMGGFVGAFLGAWVGAVPIPLDWDREWQRWPVTVLTGVWIGAVAGGIVGNYAVKGKKISLE